MADLPDDIGELERRVETLESKLGSGRAPGRRETMVMAVWGVAAVLLCWDDVTWWRGELPETAWGWVTTLAWPLIIYGYLALLAVSLVQLVRGRDAAVLREQLEEARAALEAARQRS
ncbi:MAG: hypothetical protein VX015_05415 [Planctomycetota bacterium]|nr:hypothetical protein [Planctomycetota bacterium]